MIGWIPPRLRSLLGDSLEAITEESLVSLCGLPEDYDLDYKRQRYQTGGKGTTDAAVDIASFANASGGVLIIGIEEDGNGVASRLYPDNTESDFGLWVDQVVAARISPAPTVRHCRIGVTGGSAHVVSVVPSSRKPHAVSVNNETLKYPIRSGTTTRYMFEPEIADQYARRIRASVDLESRVLAIHETANSMLAESDKLDSQCWHILSGSPSIPGNLTLEVGIEDLWGEWVGQELQSFPTVNGPFVRSASVGFRSIRLADGYGVASEFSNLFASLELDGSGFVAFGHMGNPNINRDSSNVIDVYDERVVSDVIRGLGILSNHAIRTGATGDLSIGSQLCSDHPIALFHSRGIDPGQLSNTRIVDRTTPLAVRSTPIETPSVPSRGLVALSRLILTDIFSSFGRSHSDQITADNQLDLHYFSVPMVGQSHSRRKLVQWAEDAGVELVNFSD